MRIKEFFPAAHWLQRYQRSDWSGDWPAGLTVGVMLIPQGMAYAMIAGLPVVYGLYAAFGMYASYLYLFAQLFRENYLTPKSKDAKKKKKEKE